MTRKHWAKCPVFFIGGEGRPARVNIGYVHAKNRREPLRPHGMDGSVPRRHGQRAGMDCDERGGRLLLHLCTLVHIIGFDGLSMGS